MAVFQISGLRVGDVLDVPGDFYGAGTVQSVNTAANTFTIRTVDPATNEEIDKEYSFTEAINAYRAQTQIARRSTATTWVTVP